MKHALCSLVLLVSCASVAVPVYAACTVGLLYPSVVQSGQDYSVLIKPAGDLYKHVITEEWAGKLGTLTTPRSSVEAYDSGKTQPFSRRFYRHRTTSDLAVMYRVVATSAIDPNDSCIAEGAVLVRGDPELDRATRRVVIPVVGTTAGVNGALFKTSLKLHGPDYVRGRLVFHPIGVPGSDSDPSIPFDFAGKTEIVYTDLMASFGFNGVGSLDIVPEGTDLAPFAETRIYNVSPAGSFGTMEPMIIPAQWFGLEAAPGDARQAQNVIIPSISAGTRVNLGICSFEQLWFNIEIRHADGTRSISGNLMLPANTLRMGSPSQLAFPKVMPDLVPGDSVTVSVSDGAGVPFYTVNDNATNDPAAAGGQSRQPLIL